MHITGPTGTHNEVVIHHQGMTYTYVGVTPPIVARVTAMLRSGTGAHGSVFNLLQPYTVEYACVNVIVAHQGDVCEVNHCGNEVTTVGWYIGEQTPMCEQCQQNKGGV